MIQRLFKREVTAVFADRQNTSDIVKIGNPDVPGKEPLRIDFQVEKELALGTLNRADLTIYNLSDSTAAKINFRKPVLDQTRFQEQRFGRKVEIFAGYKGFARRIFKGIVVSAITSKKGTVKQTVIQCINDFYEVMNTKIAESFSAGSSKSQAIMTIISKIGLPISAAAKSQLQARMAGQVFKDETNLEGTAYSVINKINRSALGIVNVSFGDTGVRFNPVGIPLEGEPELFYNQNNGLIGTPQPTDIGCNFTVQLDNELKIGSPVSIDSETIRSFFALGKFVARQIIHDGSNYADGDFQSRVVSVFNRSALGADLLPAVPIS